MEQPQIQRYSGLVHCLLFSWLLLGSLSSNAFEGISKIAAGARAQSMAGTGVAADTGTSGLMNNPATLALGSGNAWEAGFDFIFPVCYVASTEGFGKSYDAYRGPNRDPYLAPHGGYTRRINEQLTVGFGVFSKGGAGAEYGKSSVLSIDSSGVQTNKDIGSRLLGVDVPFGFAYKVNERFSIGGSFDVVWTGTNLRVQFNSDQLQSALGSNALRVSNNAGMAAAFGGLVGAGGGGYLNAHKKHFIDGEMSAFGIGGRFGITYQLTTDTRLGASFTTKTVLPDLEGHLEAEGLNPGGSTGLTLAGKVKIENFQWPAMLQLGLEHRMTDRLTVRLDTRYAWWSDVMDAVRIRFRVDTDSLGNSFSGETIDFDIPQNWDDTLAIAFGLEYRPWERWTARAGFSMIDNPIPADNLLPTIPTVFEKHITFGVGYKLGKSHSIDGSYFFGISDAVTNNTRPLTSTYGAATGGTTFDIDVHKVVVTYRRDF